MSFGIPDDIPLPCHWPGLTTAVDVYDLPHLFDTVSSERVVELSRLGGQPGFSGIDSVRKSTGVSLRRLLSRGLGPVDLAMALCRRLQDVSGVALPDFHSVLLCHSHTDPEQCQRIAAELEERLGLSPRTVVPFNHGCSGFLKLLQEGTQRLQTATSDAEIALISVETPESWHDAADRLFCGIVSCGATAAVLSQNRGLPITAVATEDFRIPAEQRVNSAPLFHRETSEVFTFRGETAWRTVMRMNPEPVFVNGIELMLSSLRSALAEIDLQPGQRIIAVPHQPSAKLLRALVAAARSEFPQVEFLNNLDQYGNTISSSIPTILSRLPEVLAANECPPLRNEDHLILLSAGICMHDISDQMTAGYACLRWTCGALNSRRTLLPDRQLQTTHTP